MISFEDRTASVPINSPKVELGTGYLNTTPEASKQHSTPLIVRHFPTSNGDGDCRKPLCKFVLKCGELACWVVRARFPWWQRDVFDIDLRWKLATLHGTILRFSWGFNFPQFAIHSLQACIGMEPINDKISAGATIKSIGERTLWGHTTPRTSLVEHSCFASLRIERCWLEQAWTSQATASWLPMLTSSALRLRCVV